MTNGSRDRNAGAGEESAAGEAGSREAEGAPSSGELREALREKYGAAARRAAESGEGGCCGADGGDRDPITSDLYGEAEAGELPASALEASLGCGNPTALADLREGETVLDLGSGAGADVLLSARRVGPEGTVYGVDMTEEMLEEARENARRAGAENVEFRRGEIEDLPLADASVDVVISNCVINLSADKDRVLSEAFRVLEPGGRFAVSDIVVRAPVPPELRRDMELWAGCVAGALEEGEYRRLLAEAGFEEVEIEPTRVYRAEDAASLADGTEVGGESLAEAIDGRLMAAFVRGRKPVR